MFKTKNIAFHLYNFLNFAPEMYEKKKTYRYTGYIDLSIILYIYMIDKSISIVSVIDIDVLKKRR